MSVSSVDSSLMSRNFVSVSSGESKYVKASRVGAQIERSASINRQQAILEAGIAACAAAKTPAQVALEAKKAARQMGFAMQASVSEESERNLKEIKKRIEELAKKAAESKDSADGKGAVDQPLPQQLPQTDQKSQATPAPSVPATEAAPAEAPQANPPAAQVQPAQVAVAAGDSAGASAAPQAAVNPSVNVYV